MKLIILNNDNNGNITVHLMADSTMLRSRQPFFVPDHAPHYAVEPVLALRIGRLGKCIAQRFAHRYIDAVTAAFIVKPLDDDMHPASLGGMEAIIDGAAMMGAWQPCDCSLPLPTMQWSHNDSTHTLTPQQLQFNVNEVIETLSRYGTLKMGDIICMGYTPQPLQAIAIGDVLSAHIDGKPVVTNKIK